MDPSHQTKELFYLAILLTNEIRDLLKERGTIKLSGRPSMKKKPITEFGRRMRIDGLEKFNGPTFIAAINFYLNLRYMLKEKPVGAIVIYVEEEYLPIFLEQFNYPAVDVLDEEVLKDACGTLCNVMAGRFKLAIAKSGYQELEMSPFVAFRNNSVNGIVYDSTQEYKYEISFEIEERKRLVIELTMGSIQGSKGREIKNTR